MLDVLLPDARGDARAPVAALRAVAVVAEARHQLGPRGARCAATFQPGLRRPVAEAVARQRRAHDVERVGRVAAVRDRIGERADDLVELDDRARPAVGDHERQRVRLRGPHVEEVDAEAVELGAELRERVEARLGRPPVVLRRPVRAQLLHVRERDALRPVVDGLGLGPAGASQPLPEVDEILVRDVDAERHDLVGHANPLGWREPIAADRRAGAERRSGGGAGRGGV